MIKLFVGIFFTMSTCIVQAQLQKGAIAPEIALPDVNDSIIKLSSFAGKVVLIDFWASWCVPCRWSNPLVRKLYEKYKDRGFQVFAVSIDFQKEAWLQAIREDKLSYTHVVDNRGWYAQVIQQYFVDGIPMSFLLDKTGKIIAVNPERRKLEKKIVALLR